MRAPQFYPDNRETKVDTPYQGSPATVSYTADNLNQYTLIGGVSQVHDDAGNLTDNGTYDFAYDYRNNLVRVAYGAVILSACEFDALSRRTTQTTADGNFTTVYFYDGEHVVEEYDGSDELLRKFVYGQRIDEIRVMISPDYADVDDDQNTSEMMNFYYHMSLLGTVTHITDEGENVVESYEYTPYGETTIKDISGSTISTSAIENPYRYTARRQDDSTGLYHYRRRAYDPARGRFNQRDPLGNLTGILLHEYVNSTPTIHTDPRGLCGGRYPDPAGDDIPPAKPNAGDPARPPEDRLEVRTVEPSTVTLAERLPVNTVPSGSVPEKKCGPDITDWLADRMMKIKPAFDALAIAYQLGKLTLDKTVPGLTQIQFALYATDSEMMDPKQYGQPTKSDCPTDCHGSLTLCGYCVSIDTPGNIMFAFFGHVVVGMSKLWIESAALAFATLVGGQENAKDHAGYEAGYALHKLFGELPKRSFCDMLGPLLSESAALMPCTPCNDQKVPPGGNWAK